MDVWGHVERQVPTVEVMSRLETFGVLEVPRHFRWFGHAKRKVKDDWVGACRNIEVVEC